MTVQNQNYLTYFYLAQQLKFCWAQKINFLYLNYSSRRPLVSAAWGKRTTIPPPQLHPCKRLEVSVTGCGTCNQGRYNDTDVSEKTAACIIVVKDWMTDHNLPRRHTPWGGNVHIHRRETLNFYQTVFVLGAFTRMREPAINFVMSVCP
jgi:hypothetical protein